MSDFRLHSLKIWNHPVLGELDIVFSQNSVDGDGTSPYLSVVIGKNGVGKSYMLCVLADIFRAVDMLQSGQHSKRNMKYQYVVTYEIDGEKYVLQNFPLNDALCEKSKRRNLSSVYATCDGVSIDISEVLLPTRIIASTMTISDRFATQPTHSYRYKGLRGERTPNLIGTRSMMRTTIYSILSCIRSKYGYKEEFRYLLCNLNLRDELLITFEVRYKDIFLREDISCELLLDMIEHWDTYFKNRVNAPWGLKKLSSELIKDSFNINSIIMALNFIRRTMEHTGTTYFVYDILCPTDELEIYVDGIRLLVQMDVLSRPTIHVSKEYNRYELANSSSGESQILCQFINILSEIKHDSLVLIDEPENSCHPEWQMAYVAWLNKVFRNYSNCHFVIATHSPLILTNVQPMLSCVISLHRDEYRTIIPVSGNSYGWNVDEILQDVMGMTNTMIPEYIQAEKAFNEAIDNDDKVKACEAYAHLLTMMHPNNVLREVLKCQLIGVGE